MSTTTCRNCSSKFSAPPGLVRCPVCGHRLPPARTARYRDRPDHDGPGGSGPHDRGLPAVVPVLVLAAIGIGLYALFHGPSGTPPGGNSPPARPEPAAYPELESAGDPAVRALNADGRVPAVGPPGYAAPPPTPVIPAVPSGQLPVPPSPDIVGQDTPELYAPRARGAREGEVRPGMRHDPMTGPVNRRGRKILPPPQPAPR